MIDNEDCPYCGGDEIDYEGTQEWINDDDLCIRYTYTCRRCGKEFFGNVKLTVVSRIVGKTDEEVERRILTEE